MDLKNKEYKYKWRKASFKSSQNLMVYEIRINKDYVSYKIQNYKEIICWNYVKRIQILNVDGNTHAIKVVYIDEKGKRKSFYFNNQYCETLKIYKYLNHDFNQMIKAIHRFCMPYSNNIKFIKGDTSSYIFWQIIRVLYWLFLPSAFVLGIIVVIKSGNLILLFAAVAFGAGIYPILKNQPSHKQVKYNPIEVSKIGIKELNK